MKHGLAKDLPLFRTCVDNNIPYLGNFGYSPIHLYVKKDKSTGQIVQIQTLDRIFDVDKFLDHVASLTGIQGFRDKIVMDKIATLKQHIRMETLSENYDYDSDMTLVDEKKNCVRYMYISI